MVTVETEKDNRLLVQRETLEIEEVQADARAVLRTYWRFLILELKPARLDAFVLTIFIFTGTYPDKSVLSN